MNWHALQSFVIMLCLTLCDLSIYHFRTVTEFGRKTPSCVRESKQWHRNGQKDFWWAGGTPFGWRRAAVRPATHSGTKLRSQLCSATTWSCHRLLGHHHSVWRWTFVWGIFMHKLATFPAVHINNQFLRFFNLVLFLFLFLGNKWSFWKTRLGLGLPTWIGNHTWRL